MALHSKDHKPKYLKNFPKNQYFEGKELFLWLSQWPESS
jgi:hypothetical protein